MEKVAVTQSATRKIIETVLRKIYDRLAETRSNDGDFLIRHGFACKAIHESHMIGGSLADVESSPKRERSRANPVKIPGTMLNINSVIDRSEKGLFQVDALILDSIILLCTNARARQRLSKTLVNSIQRLTYLVLALSLCMTCP